MKVLNIRGMVDNAATRVRNLYSTVRNDLVRSPKADCLVSKKLTSHSVQSVEDARTYLKGLTNKDNTPKYVSEDVEELLSYIKTPEQARLTAQLSQFKLRPHEIGLIASSVKTPKEAKYKFDLTQKLFKLLGDEASDGIPSIVLSADTQQQAKFKYELAKKLVGKETKFAFFGNTFAQPQFKYYDIASITAIAQIKEQAQLASKMIENSFGTCDITSLMIHADTPKKVQLANKLLDGGVSPLNIGSELSFIY